MKLLKCMGAWNAATGVLIGLNFMQEMTTLRGFCQPNSPALALELA